MGNKVPPYIRTQSFLQTFLKSLPLSRAYTKLHGFLGESPGSCPASPNMPRSLCYQWMEPGPGVPGSSPLIQGVKMKFHTVRNSSMDTLFKAEQEGRPERLTACRMSEGALVPD